MKILITGVSGFIGNSLKNVFEEHGHEVFGADVIMNQPSSHMFKVDFVSLNDVECLLENINPDVIVHCAGNASVPMSVENPLLDLERNVTVTETLLLAMRKLVKKPRLLFLSSAGVYGNQEINPVTEEATPKPLSPYGLHKYFCEQVCLYYVKNYNYDIKIARIFSAYGAGLKKQIFWDMSEKLAKTNELQLGGSGEESRDFVHIKDLIEALYLLATTESSDVIFNVASGKDTKIKDIASIFVENSGYSEDVIHFSGKVREGDPKVMRADISRLKTLGFQNKVDIQEGIKDYISWYKELTDGK